MSNLQHLYTRFLELFQHLTPEDNFLHQIRKPKLSDKQLIALSLAAEAASIDSELNLFTQLPDQIKGQIERSVYNRRRRQLAPIIEQFRQDIGQRISPTSSLHLIDSMPLEVCKLSRAKHSRICSQQEEQAPSYGYCAAQKLYYFGYKIHATCTASGVFKTFDVSKASVHDIHYLNDVQSHLNHCVLIGDKGYLSQTYQQDLFDQSAIKLHTPMRNNQIDYVPFPAIYRKARKRIETLFSQLCDQFMIRRNYAKSFGGFASRILAKITALTLLQWHNKLNNHPINHLKSAIC